MKFVCISAWYYGESPSGPDEDKFSLVWPWEFGWKESQEFKTLHIGPIYLRWRY